MFPETMRRLGIATEFPAGAEMPYGSTDSPCVYLLLKGCVTIENTDETAVAVAWPNDLVGMPGVARAATEVTCLRIPEQDLLAEMGRSPEVAAWVWREQTKRINELRRRIGLLNGASVEQRVLATVADLGDRARAADPNAIVPLAQKEVAELAGATRETTSTLLNRLRRMGLVTMRRRRIVVSEPEQLRALGATSDTSEEPAAAAAAAQASS